MYITLKQGLIDALMYELVNNVSPFREKNLNYEQHCWEFLEDVSVSAGSQFFSARTIAMVTEAIASDFNLFHFTQSFYGRVHAYLELSPQGNEIITNLPAVINRSHAQRHHIDSILSPERVAQSTVEPSDLRVILDGNPWLVVLYYLFITGAYGEVRAKLAAVATAS